MEALFPSLLRHVLKVTAPGLPAVILITRACEGALEKISLRKVTSPAL